MTVSILSASLSDLSKFFDDLPEVATKAARMAINQVAEREGLAMIRQEMNQQVAFPKGYLAGDRLGVTKRATDADLTAVITGRDRPTSLARFAQGQTPENTRRRPIRLEVKRGQTRVLRGAFLVRLKNGNIGLAVRLKPGERLENSDRAKQLANNVYLLYGPSVEQVFKGVAGDVSLDLSAQVDREFLRQFGRLTRG